MFQNDIFIIPPRFYSYNDEKITQILSSYYISQALPKLHSIKEFASNSLHKGIQ